MSLVYFRDALCINISLGLKISQDFTQCERGRQRDMLEIKHILENNQK